MSESSTVSAEEDDATDTPALWRQWPAFLAAMGAIAGTGLAWLGGLPAMAGVLACATSVGWWMHSRASTSPRGTKVPAEAPQPQAAAARQAPAPSSDSARRAAAGAAVSPMVTEVVPVWSRQIEASRTSADEGLANVLGAFSEISTALDTLLGSLSGMTTSSEPGAVDSAIEQSSGPLGLLLAPSQRAFEQRDLAVAELDHCSRGLQELTQLARQAKEIGRHTRLVAFNASIEASRDNTRDGGNQAVAQEMRLLASRMGETGEAIHRAVTGLAKRVDTHRHAACTQETSPTELRMELDMRARESLQALLSAIGASLSTSGSVRDSSVMLRQHLDQAFVHFQFGDRVSQMLAIIGNDMNNFVDWVARNPNATIDDASEWLQRLEASYTMEEQRSEHHGNVHVDRGSEVEFF